MKRIVRRILLPTAVAIVLRLAIFSPGSVPALGQNARVQVIEVTAKKYEYSPAPIHVKSGTKIQLEITATDHDHGFSIRTVPDGADSNARAGLVFTSAQECWQLKKGETTTVEFLAQTPGTYSFKCCHTCGLGHRGMKGLLIVEP
jgi:cytochrome c oxidase subunit II